MTNQATVDPRVIDPPHYRQGPVETIEVTRHLSFDLGNALRYAMRAGHKPAAPAVQDFTKALWYLNDHIAAFGPNADHQVDADAPLRRIIHAERDDLRREVYLCLLFGDIARMREAIAALIAREDEPTAGTARPTQAPLFVLPGFSGLTDLDEVVA